MGPGTSLRLESTDAVPIEPISPKVLVFMPSRIGIDIGGTKIEGVLMGEKGTIDCRRRVSTPKDYANTLLEVKRMVDLFDRESGEELPVGLGTPGSWVPAMQVMKNAKSTALDGRPFLDDIRKVLSRPVRIQNDANCFVLSEVVDGAGQDGKCVFGVILGTGVGGGWAIDGKVLRGPNGLSGEWGHNPLPNFRLDPRTSEQEVLLSNRQCHCGQINCVEVFVSGGGLSKSYFELTGKRARAKEIGSQGMSTALDLYISQLARALAVVVNTIDPDIIVLGGGVSNIAELYERLPARVYEYACHSENRSKIVPAMHSEASGARGAAWLFP